MPLGPWAFKHTASKRWQRYDTLLWILPEPGDSVTTTPPIPLTTVKGGGVDKGEKTG